MEQDDGRGSRMDICGVPECGCRMKSGAGWEKPGGGGLNMASERRTEPMV